MNTPSGVRIFLAAVSVCTALALPLIAHHGASGAVTAPAQPTRPSGAPSIRPQPAPGSEQVTTAPSGFTTFQMRYPDEVRETAPAYATEPQIARAHAVNTQINKQITWRETRPWTIELGRGAQGDCVQYALTKRHVLREEGVPDGAFRLVVVYAKKYEGLHMILEMRSPNDTYVLDSLENDARRHFYTVAQMSPSYSIVKYQAWGKPARWMAPSALVAETTPALRRLHDEAVVADASPWVHDPRLRGLRRATAVRLRH